MNQWRYIQDDGANAATGLAADELLMDYHLKDGVEPAPGVLRLYTYRDHCALVGRFQNIHAELDLSYCRKQDISVSRRLTGGGAIIMGRHQLGVCVTMPAPDKLTTRQLYRKLSLPLVEALKALGITASLRGKNDLEVRGRKIAGLGIYSNPHGIIQFHTSLLLDLDLELMLKVLKIPLQKLSDKMMKGIRQRITTVKEETGAPMDAREFRHLLKKAFESTLGVSFFTQTFSPSENKAIDHLAHSIYGHPDWLYSQSPQPDMNGMGVKKTAAGLLRAYVALKGQTIKSLLITGDYLADNGIFSEIESQLKWSPAEKEAIAATVEKVFHSGKELPAGIDPKDITALVWRASLAAMKEVHYNYRGACYQPAELRQGV